MSKEKKNVVYVVITQGVEQGINYRNFYPDSEVIYVYCHDVRVNIPAFHGEKHCQLFAFTPLPDTITCPDKYNEAIMELSQMMHNVLDDPDCNVLIWTFPLKTEHLGTYLQFIHSLGKRGKKLIFHISAYDMEKLYNNSLFVSVSKQYVDEGVVEHLDLAQHAN